jgi:hypothetical protein
LLQKWLIHNHLYDKQIIKLFIQTPPLCLFGFMAHSGTLVFWSIHVSCFLNLVNDLYIILVMNSISFVSVFNEKRFFEVHPIFW